MPPSQKYAEKRRSRRSFRLSFKDRKQFSQKMANFGEGDSLSGYDASGSEVSSLQREQNRNGNRRRWFAHYDTQAWIFLIFYFRLTF